MLKVWRKCADIIDHVYEAYEKLVAEEEAYALERAELARPGSREQEAWLLAAQSSLEGEPLHGGQKCASIVDKTLAVLDLPKKNKERQKMPQSQQKLPDIWTEALKDVNDWSVEELCWKSL